MQSPKDPLSQAEGYRYLSRLTRAGLEAFIEYADPKAPVLRRMVHETVKMGADNPDNYYMNAAISGEYEYIIKGRRGTVNFLGFSTQKGSYGESGGLPPTGFLDSTELEIRADGYFEVVLSCTEKAGNWLPMEPETGMVIVRQTFGDRKSEKPAELEIERIGSAEAPAPLSCSVLDAGFKKTAALTAGASLLFAKWARDFSRHTNMLPQMDPEKSTAAGGDPKIAYYHSYWSLGPDEALVIEVTPPDCEHWNFQLNNHWMESLDYRYFTVHINKCTARYQEDGSVRIVAAHKDPGIDNWLTTAGHSCGTMCFRWIRAQEHPQPQTRVVPFSEIGAT
jgi:hypothetical protein